MKYIILIFYIIMFGYIPELMGGDYSIAILGSLIRTTGSLMNAKKLMKKANALSPVRPEYEIPDQVQTVQDTAQSMAQADMPGFGRMTSEAEGAGTRFVGQARNVADSGAGMLQAASQADVNTRRNVGDINAQNQSFRASQMSNFQRALMFGADYEDQEFNVNEMQPYLQEESDKRMFTQAAGNQMNATFDSLASGADGMQEQMISLMGVPTGATGGSMFSSLFGGDPSAIKTTNNKGPYSL